ncbi:MAG: hypothetical protein K5888_10280, partial [Lachnospiraceae bacterium]|nr:hypothetical protein [Lachnospiraceae bacterium]
DTKKTINRILYGLLFAVIILPYVSGLSVPVFEKEGQVGLPYRTLINAIALIFTAVALSIEGVREAVLFFKDRKTNKSIKSSKTE